MAFHNRGKGGRKQYKWQSASRDFFGAFLSGGRTGGTPQQFDGANGERVSASHTADRRSEPATAASSDVLQTPMRRPQPSPPRRSQIIADLEPEQLTPAPQQALVTCRSCQHRPHLCSGAAGRSRGGAACRAAAAEELRGAGGCVARVFWSGGGPLGRPRQRSHTRMRSLGSRYQNRPDF